MMTKKVMVVDDEEGIRLLVGETLTKAGFQVITAGSGEEAMEILAKEPVPVIFLDLKLPGVDGVDLCRQIRQTRPIAIIYAMTGYTSLFELSDCREAGFDDYFTKPLRLPALVAAAQAAYEKLERWKQELK